MHHERHPSWWACYAIHNIYLRRAHDPNQRSSVYWLSCVACATPVSSVAATIMVDVMCMKWLSIGMCVYVCVVVRYLGGGL